MIKKSLRAQQIVEYLALFAVVVTALVTFTGNRGPFRGAVNRIIHLSTEEVNIATRDLCAGGTCGVHCGNGLCEAASGENCNNCPADCGACPVVNCGNGTCDSGENCHTCPADCGACGGPNCGNGLCETGEGETSDSCPDDCFDPNATYTYRWVSGTPGACHFPGGGTFICGQASGTGTSETTVWCQRIEDEQVVNPVHCPLDSKPPTISFCDEQCTVYRWEDPSGAWDVCRNNGTPVDCGDQGTQTRLLAPQCMEYTYSRATGEKTSGPMPVDSTLCADVPALPDTRDCQGICFRWIEGEWGECSETCGGGIKTRTVTCQRISDNQIMPDNDPCRNDPTAGSEPASEEPCNTQSCCGNGTLDTGEQCDSNEDAGGLAILNGKSCTDFGGHEGCGYLACYVRLAGDTKCTFDTSHCCTCGDGEINGTEVCDKGSPAANIPAVFGGNWCDNMGFDGGTLNCSEDCKTIETTGCYRCGNGQVDPGTSEQCDDQDLNGNAICADVDPAIYYSSCGTLSCYPDQTPNSPNECTFDTRQCCWCGDGVKNGNPVEECESGETKPCNGLTIGGVTYSGGTLRCNSTCHFLDTRDCVSNYCGDGVKNGAERCDKGNPAFSIPPDFGDRTCASEGFSGGGTLICSADCTIINTGCYRCGDGDLNGTNEECERRLPAGTIIYRADKNSCSKFSGYYDGGGTITCNTSNCLVDPSACRHCGDNILTTPPEDCDRVGGVVKYPPGKTTACSKWIPGSTGTVTCTLGTCRIDSSACRYCGNGVIESGEECDPGDPAHDIPSNVSGAVCTYGEPMPCWAKGTARQCHYNSAACERCGDRKVTALIDPGTGNPFEECEYRADGKVIDNTGAVMQCQNFSMARNGFFTAGALKCPSCQFDTNSCTGCGNDKVQNPEKCDDSGATAVTCVAVQACGPAGTSRCNSGSMSCIPTTCRYNTSGCQSITCPALPISANNGSCGSYTIPATNPPNAAVGQIKAVACANPAGIYDCNGYVKATCINGSWTTVDTNCYDK